MATSSNKSSQYTQSLVDFLLDTKPYHSKLTEVVEEYQFADTVNVKITEGSFTRAKTKAAWTYNFFSGGNVANSSFQVQRVISPDFNGIEHNSDPSNDIGRWKAGRDENTDMAGIPLVFSKKQFDGVGVADAWMEQDGLHVLPYVEGHDHFQSHGSLEMQIRRIYDAQSNFSPAFAETRTNNVISTATALTQSNEQDLARPQSAINKLITLTNTVLAWLNSHVVGNTGWTTAHDAAVNLLAVLNGGTIPLAWTTSPGDPNLQLAGYYSQIVDGGTASGVAAPTGFAGWNGEDTTSLKYIDEAYSALISPMLSNMFSDLGLQESGVLEYRIASSTHLTVYAITGDPTLDHEEWTLTATSIFPATYSVIGSISGFIGSVAAGSNFTNSRISFSTFSMGTPTLGEQVVLTPYNRFSISPVAPLETWNIIKINPRTYTRPVFGSSNYGFITDLASTPYTVSLLNPAMLLGTYVLTATSATTFAVSSTADPLYSGTATVGTVYNDGTLGFTIIAGTTHPFVVGDYFLIEVANPAAQAVNFDLYYGYDLDSYDNPDLVYNNTNTLDPNYNRSLDFRYDSRFIDYDTTSMGLAIAENAIDGRSFRLVAVPNLATPISTEKQDGSTISNSVDLAAENHEIAPVVATAVAPVFSMPGDPNPAPDVQLYFTTTFSLEYSDDNFTTKTVVGPVNVGGSFSSPALGISFTLPAGSKPFVGASSDDGFAQPRVTGGDVFYFTVKNPPPMIVNAPITPTGVSVPRLIMHGDSYYASVAADWSVSFTSPTAYTVSGNYNEGPLSGTLVSGYPIAGTLSLTTTGARANTTYRDANVHFTIVQGRGVSSGDVFSFSTHTPRASFLVHGSVSGWQPDASYGEWYWNGKIGFKITLPQLEAWTADVPPLRVPEALGYHSFPTGFVKVDYIRPDTPAFRYTFTRTTGGFVVRRSDVEVIGYAPHAGTFSDQYITVEINDPTTDFSLYLGTAPYDFWNAQDAVIVRSDITYLNPTTNDYVVIKKTEMGSLGINLDYSSLASAPDITALEPVSVDTDLVDYTTGFGGVPLVQTSPEVGASFQTGCLPIYLTKLDTAYSIAEFPDQAAIYQVYSAATNQLVGTVVPQGASLTEPTNFQFDPTFFTSYMPVNSSANVITYGTGLDENVRVLISERLNILESGSAIFENSLFSDAVNVLIVETSNWAINATEIDSFGATFNDAFGQFLPGYDNLPYDAETVNGYYDAGSPLADYFSEAQQLAGIIPLNPYQAALTPADRLARLGALQDMLSNYLVGGSVALTTFQQFLAAVNADDPINYTPVTDFGLPAQGLGIDINEKPGEGAGAAIQEGFSVQYVDTSDPFDVNGFDMLPMDTYGGRAALLFAMSLPPIGVDGGSFAASTSPLEVAGNPVSSITITFPNPPPAMAVPNIQVYRPTDTSPQPVGVVQTITNGQFLFTLPVPSEAKVIVS